MTEGQSSNSVSLNIDEIANSIKTHLSYRKSVYQCYRNGRNAPSLYKVKKQIREVDPVAYVPIILSIGPYHYSSPGVLAREKIKWKCLKFILTINNERKLQDYLTVLMEREEQIRCCYKDDINMESNNFVQMLLLDGCFLLHSLYATNEIMESSPQVSEGIRDTYMLAESVSTPQMHNEETVIAMSAEHITKAADAEKGGIDASPCLQNTKPESKDDLGDDQGKHKGCSARIGIWYTSCVARDILLLENQIPFFAMKEIYDVLAYKKAIKVPLAETFAKYIEDIVQYYPVAITESNRPQDFHHLLHLCHIYFRPSQHIARQHDYQIQPHYLHTLFHKCRTYFKPYSQHGRENSFLNHRPIHLQDGSQIIPWRRAVQYHEAGVRFKRREDSSNAPHSLLDITFDRGVLEIPCLPIDDKTCTIFPNFIAFEQACPQFGNDFTAYIAFMSRLMSSPDDVTFLSHRGIIVHHMRCDADVSNTFGKFGKNVDFDMNGKYYLKPLCLQLEAHYQNRINRWMAWLWQNHFSNPWLSLAVVAAAVVLICTVLQTWLSLLAYVHPNS